MTIAPGPTHRNQKLAGLDHLRAFAIIIVFLYHYAGLFGHPQWVSTISKFGWTGVDLFFVLSGYLISSQLFAGVAKTGSISFLTFFIKRFFRIIPAYLAVVALYFLFPSFREREALAPIWKYLSFTQNLGLDLSRQGTFSHAWSLCIEEQFYLFLPLIMITLIYFKALKKGAIMLLLLYVLGLLARWYSWHVLVSAYSESDDYRVYWYKLIYYPTYGRLDGLLTGVSIAAIFQFRPQLKNKIQSYGNYFIVAGLLILTGAYYLCLDQQSFGASVFGFPLVSIGYGFMVAGAISPASVLYQIKPVVTSRIAALSYAIYLTHKIVIHITQQECIQLNIDKDSNIMFFICVAASLLAAWLLNKIVEKPFLRLREKILKEKHTRLKVQGTNA